MKRYKKIILIVAVLAVSPFLWIYAGKSLSHLRHKMQEHFAEIHAALSDDGEGFGDGLTDEQLAAMDNVTAPIKTDKGDLSWQVLAEAKTKVDVTDKNSPVTPIFNDVLKALDKKTLTAKGYMFPLDAFGKQTHFLLSPYPSSCPFCRPAGPNELIEVKPTEPVEFTYNAVTVKGRFELLDNSDDVQQGMFYRMEDAVLQ